MEPISIVCSIFGMMIGNAAVIIPLFLWLRSESRNDWRHLDVKLEEHRKETNEILKAIQDEMKDFHDRLFKLEERTKEKK